MGDLGFPSGPAQPEPTADSSSEIPLWVLVAAIAVMLVGAAVAAGALLQATTGKSSKPSYPATWDPRVVPFVRVVEKQRGLTFLHPVAVRFLPADQFEKTVTTDEKKLGKDDRKQIDQTTGLLRALGLITGNVDLFAAFNHAHGSGTLAYYSFADQRITIRGSSLTLASRPTLVHELTHALQDQRFGIGARLKNLEKASQHGSTTTEYDVLDAIVEGDAERVADLYRSSLPARQRRAVAAAEAAQDKQGTAQLAGVPKVVLTMISSPYTLGQALVEAASADGGNHAVDALFLKAPTHDAALLDPFQVLAGDTGATTVAVPKLGDGEKKFDSGEFGDLTWYFMLAERLPLRDALQAADGWGGDAYVGFDRNGTSCARVAYSGDTPVDTTRMFNALQTWIAAAPGSPAQVRHEGALVVFESCDPGTTATVGKDASIDALSLVATRAYLAVGILRSGGTKALAQCVAGRLALEYPVSQLTDPKFATGGPTRTRVQQIAAGCH